MTIKHKIIKFFLEKYDRNDLTGSTNKEIAKRINEKVSSVGGTTKRLERDGVLYSEDHVKGSKEKLYNMSHTPRDYWEKKNRELKRDLDLANKVITTLTIKLNFLENKFRTWIKPEILKEDKIFKS